MAYWDCCVKAAACIGIWENCWLPQGDTRTKTQPQRAAACRSAVSGPGSVRGTEELRFHWVEHMLTAQWYPDAGPTKEQRTHASCTITPWYSTKQRTRSLTAQWHLDAGPNTSGSLQSVLRQVRSLFQSKFSAGCGLVLPLSISSIFSFP
jgi:hypothetical protein